MPAGGAHAVPFVLMESASPDPFLPAIRLNRLYGSRFAAAAAAAAPLSGRRPRPGTHRRRWHWPVVGLRGGRGWRECVCQCVCERGGGRGGEGKAGAMSESGLGYRTELQPRPAREPARHGAVRQCPGPGSGRFGSSPGPGAGRAGPARAGPIYLGS